MTHIYKDDQLLANIPFEAVAEWLKDQSINPEDVRVEMSGAETRQVIRGRIHEEVADPESLLGTTADAAALNLLATSILVQVLAAQGSKAIKAGLSAAMDGQLVPLTASFIAQVNSGEIKLPALTKGIKATVADIAKRSTGVANVLEQALGGEG